MISTEIRQELFNRLRAAETEHQVKVDRERKISICEMSQMGVKTAGTSRPRLFTGMRVLFP
jgi:hypothetical protein